jgi:Fe-S cluster biogenesis protein NfuA
MNDTEEDMSGKNEKMSDNQELFDRVDELIEKEIKYYVQADGGKIKLKRIEDGIAYVEMGGACRGCPAINFTLKGTVEHVVKMHIPEIEEVRMDY